MTHGDLFRLRDQPAATRPEDPVPGCPGRVFIEPRDLAPWCPPMMELALRCGRCGSRFSVLNHWVIAAEPPEEGVYLFN